MRANVCASTRARKRVHGSRTRAIVGCSRLTSLSTSQTAAPIFLTPLPPSRANLRALARVWVSLQFVWIWGQLVWGWLQLEDDGGWWRVAGPAPGGACVCVCVRAGLRARAWAGGWWLFVDRGGGEVAAERQAVFACVSVSVCVRVCVRVSVCVRARARACVRGCSWHTVAAERLRPRARRWSSSRSRLPSHRALPSLARARVAWHTSSSASKQRQSTRSSLPALTGCNHEMCISAQVRTYTTTTYANARAKPRKQGNGNASASSSVRAHQSDKARAGRSERRRRAGRTCLSCAA